MKRGRRKSAAFRAGLISAAKRRNQGAIIQGMKSASIRRTRRARTGGAQLRPGFRGGRLYPQKGVAAKHRNGLVPTPIQVGSVLIEDPAAEEIDT